MKPVITNIIIVAIIVIIYLLSAAYSWKTFNIAYSEQGTWELLSPEPADVVIVFCPLVNTIWAMTNSLDSMYEKPAEPKERHTLKKFFNVR